MIGWTTPAEIAVGNAEQARAAASPAKRCELCPNPITWKDPQTSSFGIWHYHTACWNEAYFGGRMDLGDV